MSRRLFTISDIVLIRGYGLALIPGLVPTGHERFRVGDPIMLKLPDGVEVVTRIGGLESMNPNSRGDATIVLRELSNANVPTGTEVWSVEDQRDR